MDTPGDRDDSRTSIRLDGGMMASYTIGEEFPMEHTTTYDIGTGGCAILTTIELPAGQPLIVELELRGDPRPKLRLAGVVRWSHLDHLIGKCRTGVEFTERSAENETSLLRYIDTIYRLRDIGVLH